MFTEQANSMCKDFDRAALAEIIRKLGKRGDLMRNAAKAAKARGDMDGMRAALSDSNDFERAASMLCIIARHAK